MKILLQCVNSKMFIGPAGDWVREKDQAKEFKTSAQALQFCQEHNIQTAEIVLSFPDSQYDVRLRSAQRPWDQG